MGNHGTQSLRTPHLRGSRVAEKEKAAIDQQLGYFYEGGKADVRLAE